ncbi:hypothetical protein RGQ29_002637 [Quercus rubra]|uniref:TTF-type domain-containing protein n=1 Tax=Quercus rubra TaxID=3512 RepID=A0AAN7IDY6_QUERU|nr:hypothetical protein RGQ29_002637 [Quercus rubra]
MTNLLTNNIYDPSQWENINTKLRDLLVENGSIRDNDPNFPIDKDRRHFSTTFYFKKLSNGEKFDRKWLVYSKDLDKTFCFCCKLFNSTTHDSGTNQLTNEGTNDWRNISNKIKNHETSKRHEKNEKIYQENNGKFLSLFEMIAEFDPVMQEHVRHIQHGAIHNHYLEHNIQNELIRLLSDEIKEQMTLVLRCVDISTSPIKIDEHFVEFLKVDDTSGKGLFNEVISVIKSLELDINDVRGQGYDNGSNMKGKKNKGNNVSSLILKPLSQTHWESRIESVQAIKFQALEIRDALLQLAKVSEDHKTKSEADCLATYELESFEFLLGMTIWYDILFVVNSISKNLQSKDMHIDVAIDQLKYGFTSAMISSKEIATKMEIEPIFCEKRIIHKKKQFDENANDEITQSAEESFRINYFLYIVDQAISSIEKMLRELKYKNLISNFASQKARKIDFK